MIKISPNTHAALNDERLQRNLKHVLGKTLHSRDEAVREVANWEELRQYAHQVKIHTLSRLGDYLEQLEAQILLQGGQVIWAQTAAEAVNVVLELAHRKEIDKVIKSKSMLTEEIHLNPALERARIQAVETDLGEYIVQLAGETPSHIIAPALHKSRQEIAELFVGKLQMAPTGDVVEIASTARRILREHFLSARMGITGVNFAVAENGTVVVVENEGNARLTVSMPEIHVALMGIEKVIPRMQDLAVLLKVLTRSATGQKITSYVNLLKGARRPGEREGPREFYLVLIDNGRTRVLADAFLRQTLACIRCGACQNVCPVYQRLGGHAYGSTYQGPIGAILTPQLSSTAEAPEHAYASSLCGACYEVCPVKIEIPHILLRLREMTQERRNQRAALLPLEKWVLQFWAWVMQSPDRYRRLAGWGRWLYRRLPPVGRSRLPLFRRWSAQRDLPPLPAHSFRELHSLEKGT